MLALGILSIPIGESHVLPDLFVACDANWSLGLLSKSVPQNAGTQGRYERRHRDTDEPGRFYWGLATIACFL